MTDLTHQNLLHTIASRGADSEAAMAELYKLVSGCVYAFIRNRLSQANDHDIQAIVVEVMYEVWRVADTFQKNSKVKTWILGIARYKLIDAARKGKASANHDDIDDHSDYLASDTDGDEVINQLAEQQRAEWLALCMSKLPESQRESVHLLFVEGLSVNDIAQVQKCPSGTVKTRVFHAKASLKICLSKFLRMDDPDYSLDKNISEGASI